MGDRFARVNADTSWKDHHERPCSRRAATASLADNSRGCDLRGRRSRPHRRSSRWCRHNDRCCEPSPQDHCMTGSWTSAWPASHLVAVISTCCSPSCPGDPRPHWVGVMGVERCSARSTNRERPSHFHGGRSGLVNPGANKVHVRLAETAGGQLRRAEPDTGPVARLARIERRVQLNTGRVQCLGAGLPRMVRPARADDDQVVPPETRSMPRLVSPAAGRWALASLVGQTAEPPAGARFRAVPWHWVAARPSRHLVASRDCL